MKLNRKNFLLGTAGLLFGSAAIRSLFENIRGEKMMQKLPVFFVGHGSPMNALGPNPLADTWAESTKDFPEPKAILSISAHWFTKGTYVTSNQSPPTIHDFYGFPQELFDVQYSAPGDPKLAEELSKSKDAQVIQDDSWGLDHGTWSVLRNMYPKANIPVVQLSLDATKPGEWHYEFAKSLSKLREQGVLVLGSGDLVHNLRLYDWKNQDKAHDWALDANETFKDLIQKRDWKSLANYQKLGTAVQIAIPTPEHYFPMLYALALADEKEEIRFYNDIIQSSVSLTSMKIS
ncbi:4,5-DOPA dioxygenase extradiol [Leptospira andrefontaineae]|uniref:4,5-DOPA dioxygenase extradiol n=1 Tax=Leptospira andrefontaineae TaxID=2484976 RepID=A0A4R9H8I1_9LEPT|nr:4,5-DOPA dioxygenase extradiol [Leptospira andrefontaineae]